MISAPSLDSFYAPVHSAPAPGDIVRSRTVEVATARPARAVQLVYGTLATGRRPAAVSGTVLVPRQLWDGPGPRPVVSYGVGVHGLGRDHAPSHMLRTSSEAEVSSIDEALAQGWAVAVSDGEGLGMPGPHTYGAGDSGGHAMLDILRAATDAVPELSPTAPMGLWGYSEGGRCAAWAAEAQPEYAPELAVVGAATGGVPADLRALAISLQEGAYRGLAFAVMIGLAHAYRHADLWSVLTPRGRELAARASEQGVVGLVLDHPETLTELTGLEDPWDTPSWVTVLAGERLGRRGPTMPVLIYHSAIDEIVPRSVAIDLSAAYRRLGTTVTWADIEAGDHLSAGTLSAADAVRWLAARFADHEVAGAAAR